MRVAFTIYGEAQPAGSKKGFINKKTGGVIITDANKNLKTWQNTVSEVARDVMLPADGPGHDILEGPLSMKLTFYRTRPKSHFNADGSLNAEGRRMTFPSKRPDTTKLTRGIEDALTGIVWKDDAQVVHQECWKDWSTVARVEVEVSEL